MDTNAYDVVDQFEKKIAEYAGSKYAVAVDCCTNALFLSLMYCEKQPSVITIPKRTYISIPSSIIHAGYNLAFEDLEWSGIYQLKPLPIYDGATRFRKNMYKGGYHCLSFHVKKHLKIGRGGMILTDDKKAAAWFKLARFNGRNPICHEDDTFKLIGWNFYMPNYDAARGLWLFDSIWDYNPDIPSNYPDLSKYKFTKSGQQLTYAK
jgi:dTDP-4-amino-4,6-dideoxygalactose transaminase